MSGPELRNARRARPAPAPTAAVLNVDTNVERRRRGVDDKSKLSKMASRRRSRYAPSEFTFNADWSPLTAGPEGDPDAMGFWTQVDLALARAGTRSQEEVRREGGMAEEAVNDEHHGDDRDEDEVEVERRRSVVIGDDLDAKHGYYDSADYRSYAESYAYEDPEADAYHDHDVDEDADERFGAAASYSDDSDADTFAEHTAACSPDADGDGSYETYVVPMPVYDPRRAGRMYDDGKPGYEYHYQYLRGIASPTSPRQRPSFGSEGHNTSNGSGSGIGSGSSSSHAPAPVITLTSAPSEPAPVTQRVFSPVQEHTWRPRADADAAALLASLDDMRLRDAPAEAWADVCWGELGDEGSLQGDEVEMDEEAVVKMEAVRDWVEAGAEDGLAGASAYGGLSPTLGQAHEGASEIPNFAPIASTESMSTLSLIRPGPVNAENFETRSFIDYSDDDGNDDDTEHDGQGRQEESERGYDDHDASSVLTSSVGTSAHDDVLALESARWARARRPPLPVVRAPFGGVQPTLSVDTNVMGTQRHSYVHRQQSQNPEQHQLRSVFSPVTPTPVEAFSALTGRVGADDDGDGGDFISPSSHPHVHDNSEHNNHDAHTGHLSPIAGVLSPVGPTPPLHFAPQLVPPYTPSPAQRASQGSMSSEMDAFGIGSGVRMSRISGHMSRAHRAMSDPPPYTADAEEGTFTLVSTVLDVYSRGSFVVIFFIPVYPSSVHYGSRALPAFLGRSQYVYEASALPMHTPQRPRSPPPAFDSQISFHLCLHPTPTANAPPEHPTDLDLFIDARTNRQHYPSIDCERSVVVGCGHGHDGLHGGHCAWRDRDSRRDDTKEGIEDSGAGIRGRA